MLDILFIITLLIILFIVTKKVKPSIVLSITSIILLLLVTHVGYYYSTYDEEKAFDCNTTVEKVFKPVVCNKKVKDLPQSLKNEIKYGLSKEYFSFSINSIEDFFKTVATKEPFLFPDTSGKMILIDSNCLIENKTFKINKHSYDYKNISCTKNGSEIFGFGVNKNYDFFIGLLNKEKETIFYYGDNNQIIAVDKNIKLLEFLSEKDKSYKE